MRDRESTHPFVFFFLVLPYGISSGFVSITLPFVLTRLGFSVALAASVVAIGVSSNLWRFLWGPVADLTLTARRWYLLGLGTSAATLLLLAFLPLHQNAVAILMGVVFVSQVAGTLIVLPVGGLMAHTVAENAKGRAAGWYQAGNLRRQWHRWWRRRLARESFLEGDRRRWTRARDARLGRGNLFCIRRTDCFDGNRRRTNAHFVARYFVDGTRRRSAFHHRARLLAHRRRRHEQFVVGGCA